MTSRLTSLQHIFDKSPQVLGWKYPTAINTIASNSESAAAPPLVCADEAPIISANLPAAGDRDQLVRPGTEFLAQIIDEQIDVALG